MGFASNGTATSAGPRLRIASSGNNATPNPAATRTRTVSSSIVSHATRAWMQGTYKL